MIKVTGILLALAGLALLYKDNLVIGLCIFVLGGVLAKGLYISLKSAGLVSGVGLLAFGHHQGFTPWLYMALLVCFILVFFNRRRGSGSSDMEWGCDFSFSDVFGGDGGSCDGGDGGGGD